MPKNDFEFYSLDGLKDRFVLPAPASDPYHRAYDVPLIPSLALGAIGRIIEQAGATTVQAGPATPEETSGYFFNTTLRGRDEIIRQKAKIEVVLAQEEGIYCSPLYDAYRELSRGPGAIVIPPQRDAKEGKEPARPVAYREYAAIEDNLFLLDEDDNPVNPKMRVRQIVPIRAYRWLPGPNRKSREGTVLSPTYSPRPVSLAVAQLIEVEGLNPLAEN